MTGYGSRFVRAGYKDLKPMIPVQGVPIVEWIIRGMYNPEIDHFIVVCRKEHFENGQLDERYLQSLAKHMTIAQISDWEKSTSVSFSFHKENKKWLEKLSGED